MQITDNIVKHQNMQKSIISIISALFFLLVFGFIFFNMVYGFYLNILLGLVFAIALRPMHYRISKLFRGRKRVAAIITILIVSFVILIPVAILLNVIANEALKFGNRNVGEDLALLEEKYDKSIDAINEKFEEWFNQKELLKKEDVTEIIKNSARNVGNEVIGYFTNLFSVIASSVILFMTIYYTLVDWDSLRNYIYKYSPLNEVATSRLASRTLSVVRAALKGNIIMIFVQGIAGGVGLWIAGMDYVLLLATLYGLASLVPVIGTGTIWIPSVIFLALSGNIFAAIFLALWNMLLVGSLDNFIMPMLVKKGARLHPFFVLIGVLGGISVFGLVGFIIGPTIIALLFVSIEMLKEQHLIDEPLEKYNNVS